MTQSTPQLSLFRSPVSETGTTDRSLEVYLELPRIMLHINGRSMSKPVQMHFDVHMTLCCLGMGI